MHHSHLDLAVFLIVFGSGMVVFAVVIVVAVRWQQHRNAGPRQDQWYRARRELTVAQRRRIWWASMHRRPVRQPELGPAQLAYTRYAAEAYHRAPMTRHRWIRIAVPALEFAAAAGQLIPALLSPQERAFHLFSGGFFLGLAVGYFYLATRGLPRSAQKLSHLQQQLQHRYDPQQDIALPARPATTPRIATAAEGTPRPSPPPPAPPPCGPSTAGWTSAAPGHTP